MITTLGPLVVSADPQHSLRTLRGRLWPPPCPQVNCLSMWGRSTWILINPGLWKSLIWNLFFLLILTVSLTGKVFPDAKQTRFKAETWLAFPKSCGKPPVPLPLPSKFCFVELWQWSAVVMVGHYCHNCLRGRCLEYGQKIMNKEHDTCYTKRTGIRQISKLLIEKSLCIFKVMGRKAEAR